MGAFAQRLLIAAIATTATINVVVVVELRDTGPPPIACYQQA